MKDFLFEPVGVKGQEGGRPPPLDPALESAEVPVGEAIRVALLECLQD